jgi:hypothetical protein
MRRFDLRRAKNLSMGTTGKPHFVNPLFSIIGNGYAATVQRTLSSFFRLARPARDFACRAFEDELFLLRVRVDEHVRHFGGLEPAATVGCTSGASRSCSWQELD